jgi:2-methylcitrate dehydratase PrpD
MGAAQGTPEETGGDFAYLLADWAANLRFADLSRQTAAAAKANIVDTLACAVAGSTAPVVAEIVDLARTWGGAPQASIIGFGGKVPAHHAAWVNGTMAHARDYDDTHDAAVLHAGVSVVPAALAAAELRGGVSGGDLVAAVAAGLEVVCRMGVSTRIGIIESGYIYTSLFGYFGATVAAGRVLGLDAKGMLNAIGIAYSQVSGNHQVTRDAALTKRMQPGFAAKAALVSAQLAERQVRGAQNTFEGVDGFFRVYLQNRYDADLLRDGLGSRFEFENLSYKPYPCCRFNHTAIDAALALRTAGQIDPSAIRRIEARVNKQAYEAVCTPVPVRKGPRTVVQAQFSIPYTVAAALIDGSVGLRHFTDASIARPDILALAQRVDALVDDEIEAAWGRFISPTYLRVEMTDGRVFEERVLRPTGDVSQPMSEAAIAAKLEDCIAHSVEPLRPDAARYLQRTVGRLEQLGDASALLDCLVPLQDDRPMRERLRSQRSA